LLAYGDGRPRPFADLQQRIGRLRRVPEVATTIPVVFVAYDLLEHRGVDIRDRPLRDRRAALIEVTARSTRAGLKTRPYDAEEARGGASGEDEVAGVAAAPEGRARVDDESIDPVILLSEALTARTWESLAELRAGSRARGVEGLMLKRVSSPYRVGRRKGDWWKWKIDPHTVDAVLIYAQPGSGRRATLFTDYTFGVWDGDELVPVAKAYSGLTDAEIDELDRWVRRHTTERFGPVSAVEPVHVFELGFERIARSTRHRSGIAVRFPRMLRWRRDKSAREADTLETLKTLLDDPVSRS
jgi:DNA ligase 1